MMYTLFCQSIKYLGGVLMNACNELSFIKKVTSVLLGIILGLLVLDGFLSSAAPTTVHLLSRNAVDGGNKIHYSAATEYEDYLPSGISGWNNLGGPKFAKDTASTVQDLKISDVYSKGEATYGLYVPIIGGQDKIYFNIYMMDKLPSTNQKSVVAHELGHAIGLGDHYSGYSGALMYGYGNSNKNTKPQSHDKSDFNKLWK